MRKLKKKSLILGSILVMLLLFLPLSLHNFNDTSSNSHASYGDDTPPYTEINVWYTEGKNGWCVSCIKIALYADDSTPSAFDEESGVQKTLWRLDGGAWQVYGSAIRICREGTHFFEYYSVDYAGNKEGIHNYSFKIDLFPPTVKIVFPSGHETLNGTITILWEASDTVDMELFMDLEYNYNNETKWNKTLWFPIILEAENDGEHIWNISTYSEGNYTIRLCTEDDAGHQTNDTLNNTFIIEHPPPIVELTKPKDGFFYFRDIQIVPINRTTIIIGNITMRAEASSEIGIKKIEFYLEDETTNSSYSHVDYNEPYKWEFDEIISGKCILTVIAYDETGKEARVEKKLWMLNR